MHASGVGRPTLSACRAGLGLQFQALVGEYQAISGARQRLQEIGQQRQAVGLVEVGTDFRQQLVRPVLPVAFSLRLRRVLFQPQGVQLLLWLVVLVIPLVFGLLRRVFLPLLRYAIAAYRQQ